MKQRKPTHRNGYLKLIVDGQVFGVFPASQKTPYHDRMARLKGCSLQPAIEKDYRAFLKQNGKSH